MPWPASPSEMCAGSYLFHSSPLADQNRCGSSECRHSVRAEPVEARLHGDGPRQAQGERWRDVYGRLELNRLAFGHRHHTGLAAFHRRLKFGQRAFGQHWRSASLSSWLRNASAILPMRLRWRSETGCFGAASSNEWLCRRRSRSRMCRWSGRHAWCRAVCWSGRHSTIPEKKHRER